MRIRSSAWLAAVAALALAAGPGYAPEPESVYTPKRLAEAPAKKIVVGSGVVQPAPLKETKNDVIEPAAKALVRDQSGFVNPKVAPGKVSWHASFAAACAASKQSGKPVLLFQMMGKLDEQFC